MWRSLFSVLLVGGIALTGCASTSGPSGRPTQSSSPGTANPDDPCAVVSAEELSEITGRSLTVASTWDDADAAGDIVICNSVADASEPLSVKWRLEEALGSLEEEAQAEAFGLEPRSITLAGGTPAALIEGEVAGIPIGRVVTLRDGDLLVVEARLLGLDESDLNLNDLSRIATEVAELYVGAGSA